VSLLYLDASALVKLIVQEAESAALRAELTNWDELFSSIVSRVEVPRAVRRAQPGESSREIDAVLDPVSYIDIDMGLARAASGLEPVGLRSLDAIHLATALSLGDDLGAFATYDARLSEAATEHGIPVIAPT
jgi:predicted nucleic acid-binding protein